MYSKLIPEQELNRLLQQVTPESLKGRRQGATLGLSLEVIGLLMQKGQPYKICIKGYDISYQSDRNLLEVIQKTVGLLELKHFVFDKKLLTVEYDIFHKQ